MAVDYAKKRIEEDFSPTFPDKNIICKTCVYKKPGVLGYRTAYCEKYKKGKPNEILFNGMSCVEYKDEL